MNKHKARTAVFWAGAMSVAGSLGMASAVAADAGSIMTRTCGTCHTESSPGAGDFSRMSGMRKTPEGWQMTINRMQSLRGLHLSADEKQTVIKHLADTRGLAPGETVGSRYLLEQDTNLVENTPEAYTQMCARCHSGARVALQRRTEDEWKWLVHFHMGQHPTLEFHSLARDRPWFELALNDTAVQLGKDYPLESAEWKAWQAAPKPQLNGEWRLLGYVPGKGEFDARMTATPTGLDAFALTVAGRYADGSPLAGTGSATVYTGFEWRAALELDGVKMRQVLAAAPAGGEMQGRMFRRDDKALGGELRAVRPGANAQVLAVMPPHLKIGVEQPLTIVGEKLGGDISLGKGVEVLRVVSRDAERVSVIARAKGASGARDVKVGTAAGKGLLAVYDQVARVEVLPANAIARIGGGGGVMEKVGVAYRARAYAAGPDGKPGTDDDVALGYMPTSWSIAPADHTAEEERDHEFAGSIDANGVFTPGDGGPNPKRKMNANNVGRLAVVATVKDGAEPVEGRGSLLVSVPDFVVGVLD